MKTARECNVLIRALKECACTDLGT